MRRPASRARTVLGSTAIRPFVVTDAPRFAEAVIANRSHIEPWEPIHGERHWTVEGQREVLRRDVEAWTSGFGYAFAVLDAGADDRIIGRIALANVVLGAWRNATLGYWVAADVGGRGHATAAVRLICDFGFGDLGLHRIQPAVIPRNHRSQRVLEKVGFRREGRALAYLNIAGRWEDHDLFALTAEEWPPRRDAAQ